MPSKAVFFDRDDTLIDDPGYLRDPDGVRLAPGAAEAVGRLRRAGYRIIVVTNQSGIARGLLDEETLAAIHDRMKQLFAEEAATIDAIYYCPYLDGAEAVVERYRRDSDLRKPRPGMYYLAAREQDIDLPSSWSIGDSARDTQAGRAAGCRTIQLVRGDADDDGASPDYRFHTLAEAAECILKAGGPTPSGRGTDEGAGKMPVVQAEAGKMAAVHDEADKMSAVRAEADKMPAARAEAGKIPAVQAGGLTRSERLLDEIAGHLRVWQRQRSMEDFTFAKLVGVIAEIVAVGVAFWALMAMVDTRPDVFPSHRWLAAIFFQLLALTFFHLHRQR